MQSYNPRRTVPRSNISMSDLEQCLSKASFAAAQNSGIFRILNLSESLRIFFSTDLGNKSNNVHFLAFSMCISFKINNLWIFPTFFIYLNLLTLFL